MDERTDTKRMGTPDRRALAPYGAWRSPVTAKLIAEGGVGTMWPQSVGESLYWTELRPLEDGRYVVVRRAPDGEIADVTPAGVSARTLVHEYGGGMYVAFRGEDGGESVVFSDQADQRLYRQDLRSAGEEGPVRRAGRRSHAGRLERPAPHHARSAGRARPPLRRRARHARRSPARERARAARGRRRGGQRPGQPARRRVGRASRHRLRPRLLRRAAHQPGRAPSCLALVGPPAHAVGRHGAVDGGARRRRQRHRRAARRRRPGRGRSCSRSGARTARSGSPATAPAGGTCTRSRPVSRATPAGPSPARSSRAAAEFASVPWVFGLQSYVFLDDGRLLVCYTEDGRDHLAVLDPATGDASHEATPLRTLDSPYTVVYSLTPLGDRAGMIAATHTEGWQVATLDPATGAADVVRRGRPVPDRPRVHQPPGADRVPHGGRPHGARHLLPAGEPGLRRARGRAAAAAGQRATAARPRRTTPSSTSSIQYWTVRGIAVVDVNYGGSRPATAASTASG